MYYDALTNDNLKKELLEKSILLMEYYIEHTKEYSFEIHTLFNNIKNELNVLID